MLLSIYKRSLHYFSNHPLLNSLAHVAAGFGIAVLIQHYLPDNVLLNLWVGWTLILVSSIIHIRSCMK